MVCLQAAEEVPKLQGGSEKSGFNQPLSHRLLQPVNTTTSVQQKDFFVAIFHHFFWDLVSHKSKIHIKTGGCIYTEFFFLNVSPWTYTASNSLFVSKPNVCMGRWFVWFAIICHLMRQQEKTRKGVSLSKACLDIFFDKQHHLNASKMDVTPPKHWLTPALVSLLYPSGYHSRLRWPLIMLFLDSPLYLPSSLICQLYPQKWAENEWEERKRGLRVGKREMERGKILIVTGQSYWEPDDDTSASVWRCVDGVMGWWWHLEMDGGRQSGRWRANAYRLWPLGTEMPLTRQG